MDASPPSRFNNSAADGFNNQCRTTKMLTGLKRTALVEGNVRPPTAGVMQWNTSPRHGGMVRDCSTAGGLSPELLRRSNLNTNHLHHEMLIALHAVAEALLMACLERRQQISDADSGRPGQTQKLIGSRVAQIQRHADVVLRASVGEISLLMQTLPGPQHQIRHLVRQ